MTLNQIAALAEQFSERLRTTRALRDALRTIAANIRDAAAPSPPETPAREGTMGDRDRLRDGIEAAARVLAANGIDARSHLDLRPDARREITEILASASPASAPRETPPPPTTKENIRRALSPEAQDVEARFLLDAVSRAIAGEDPGDFAASFPVVSDAMEIASRCASAECARDDHRASLVQYEKDWHRLMLLIAEVTGEEDPAAAVDDGFDPWSALGKMRFPPPEAPASGTAEPALAFDEDGAATGWVSHVSPAPRGPSSSSTRTDPEPEVKP